MILNNTWACKKCGLVGWKCRCEDPDPEDQPPFKPGPGPVLPL